MQRASSASSLDLDTFSVQNVELETSQRKGELTGAPLRNMLRRVDVVSFVTFSLGKIIRKEISECEDLFSRTLWQKENDRMISTIGMYCGSMPPII